MPDPPAPIDSSELENLPQETLAEDSTKKKGIFGLFKKGKKDKEEKPPKERRRDRKNNQEGTKEEEDN